MEVILNKLKKQWALVFPFREIHDLLKISETYNWDLFKIKKMNEGTCPALILLYLALTLTIVTKNSITPKFGNKTVSFDFWKYVEKHCIRSVVSTQPNTETFWARTQTVFFLTWLTSLVGDTWKAIGKQIEKKKYLYLRKILYWLKISFSQVFWMDFLSTLWKNNFPAICVSKKNQKSQIHYFWKVYVTKFLGVGWTK